MDFFRINSSDFNELFFDFSGLKKMFNNKENSFGSSLKPINRKGFYTINSKRIGNIYLTKSYGKFSQDTIIKSNEGIKNVSMYFVKKGSGVYSFNKRTKSDVLLPSNSQNIFFMQDTSDEISILKKNIELETIGIHLPDYYFEHLAHLYPDFFEDVFYRFQNGESFYVNNNFRTITMEMNHILSQIENANLIGNCIEPYIDAKILELLCLQIQNTEKYSCSKIIKDEDKVREASFILLSDIHNPPSIRELSLKVGINEKKLKQGFKSVFRTTVYGYLFEYKMNLAEQLVRNTLQSTSEIALQCGYDYSSHFCTAFKRKFGISPLEMRKNQ